MNASIVVTLVLLAGAPALAQPPEAPAPVAEVIASDTPEATPVQLSAGQRSASDTATAHVQADDDRALSLDELADLRGGETMVIQHTTQTLTANNAGNTINGDTVVSGAVNLASNAFNGYDGIGNFVINTGHNNNLQGSISVSIALTPQ
jgi:hypothetical protein